MLVAAVLCLFVLGSVALVPPTAPDRGQYTYEVIFPNDPDDTYAGGRVTYDYLTGFIREDSYNSTDPNPGINGVTVWDLRDQVPDVTTVDSLAQCYVQNVGQIVPDALDFSNLQFSGYTYWNRALAEKWFDNYGGIVYFDSFNRDVVGITNNSIVNQFSYNILEWSAEKPDGSLFYQPEAANCIRLNNTLEYEQELLADIVAQSKATKSKAKINLKCIACKAGIGLIKGKVCKVAGAAACAAFPPAVPFCSTIASLLCRKIPVSNEQVCKVIRLC